MGEGFAFFCFYRLHFKPVPMHLMFKENIPGHLRAWRERWEERLCGH